MKRTPSPHGFTLIEVLVSVSVLALMLTILADMMTRTQDTVTNASAHATEFQEARRALDAISNTLSQATMDAVWAYRRSTTDASAIIGYDRTSDHHFILGPASDLLRRDAEAGQVVFFQAPLGKTRNQAKSRLHDLVNCCGFYIQYGSDLTERPDFLRAGQATVLNPERKRFRLMQYTQPSDDSLLYGDATRLGLNRLSNRSQALRWYQDDLATASKPLADNILALVLTPYATHAQGATTSLLPDPQYRYDSRDFQWNGLNEANKSRRHQLPPMVSVTIVVAEERSFEALVSRKGEQGAAEAVRGVLRDRFKEHDKLKVDLELVQQGLSALRLHHKVLSTMVALRGSKWISENEM
ncbi:uncharacterized protein (TIGR02599 family) [Roseimicrobium gellanilyticum]|uniref:Uncharacterized protein (TIGR02599 family) n=1 Tax=Roseimicrobium gellanilyticum TaxID=748857 RepID=A0A366HTJ8_9BACT|nr:Verru_Chthon cassette protein C [Roseimicrobium gellanilyticum]RBP46253.1 uncharacterized protein (TIGR02599 family) [Roseimicrobium gellanilyticum]